MLLRTLIATVAAFAALPAAAYTVDGNLADWGINKSNFASSNILKGKTIDTDSTGGRGAYVNPGWGGQAYDAEALYVDYDSTKLYVALITGHNPAWVNGYDSLGQTYAPGDFLIDFGRDGKFEYGLKASGASMGSLFKIDMSDVTLGLFTNQKTPLGAFTPYAGHKNAVSVKESIRSAKKVGTGQIKTSALVGDYGTHAGDKHYAYEASIDLSLFDAQYWNTPFDIQWTMQCGNDVISADPPSGFVPEPMSLALFGIAFAGLGLSRRRVKPTA